MYRVAPRTLRRGSPPPPPGAQTGPAHQPASTVASGCHQSQPENFCLSPTFPGLPREAAPTCRQMALAFGSMSDGFDAGNAPSALAELTGYELWERTQRSGQQVAAACERMIAAPSARARVALAPEFLRRVRQLLTLRLVAVARARRGAFPVQ